MNTLNLAIYFTQVTPTSCGRRSGHSGVPDQGLVRGRGHRDGLLHEPEEELAATCTGAGVKP